ncbi:MAG: AAA family ATPase [Verrucomicrobiales bacterium]|nr:AAA family ATPase [Verrucomicrobiae bacterium]MCP5553181.1 AAA family ATPase [Akkermansiaceae bacterium]HRX53564.1 AAA family ATPase [Verrucomicrobiales bacterium]
MNPPLLKMSGKSSDPDETEKKVRQRTAKKKSAKTKPTASKKEAKKSPESLSPKIVPIDVSGFPLSAPEDDLFEFEDFFDDDPEAMESEVDPFSPSPDFNEMLREMFGVNVAESQPEAGGMSDADPLSDLEKGGIIEHLERQPILSPRELDRELVRLGYRGQEPARRAGAVLAYRHVQRLRQRFIENVPTAELPRREHYLFLGATGSGKTYLVELLFREILKVPSVIADITRFSETGYIGDDVQMLLSQLYESAGQHRGWASCGIICVDEFDKLAASRSSARFAGEGTTKDVSGFGVQRGLLTLLSGGSSPFPTDFGFSGHGQRIVMPLENLVFIACGAFSGLKETADISGREVRVGFMGQSQVKRDDHLIAQMGSELLENTRAFSDYGILPELLGRFSRLVAFQPLGEDVLRSILEETLLRSYLAEFNREGVELTIADEVVSHIVKGALRRETGARGLRAALVPHLEEAAFESFGTGARAKVRIGLKDGRIQMEVSVAS